jgi:hypothetical protein
MKYNAPYGVSDPNAGYVNGNLSTGTMGSIPPAASIEFPQREIVAAIAAAGLTPDNADMAQLLKALKLIDQNNVFKSSLNSGTANQWSAAVPAMVAMPPAVHTSLWFKPGVASVIGGTVFSVNGSAFAQVRHPDLAQITQGDVLASAWLLLMFDGTYWQVIAGATRIIGALPLLQKNTNWYVNGATGNDATYDGTTPTVVNATVGPFKTIQRAADEVLKYNMNNYHQFINIADGTYTEMVDVKPLNGSGVVHFVGNVANPANVTVTVSGPQYCCFLQRGGFYSYEGMRLTTGPSSLDGIAIGGGTATASNLRFGPCARFHLSSGWSGAILNLVAGGGGLVIEAGAHCQSHICASLAAAMSSPFAYPDQWPAVSILGAVNMPAGFVNVQELGVLQMLYASISGAAAVNGPKFNVSMNGVLSCGGNGVNYFPGNAPGILSTGGQYN